MITIRQVDDAHIDQLRELLHEYLQPMLDDPELYAIDLTAASGFASVEDEVASLPGHFVPPRGRFLVAMDDDRVVGCAALNPISETVCELKRMYVQPAYRGLKIGSRLAEALVAAAHQSGYRRMILDSHVSMTAAHRVYRAIGFKDVPAPGDFPEALRPLILFMELDLTDT